MGKTSQNLLIFALLAAILAIPAILIDKFEEYGPELLSNAAYISDADDQVVQEKSTGPLTVTSGVVQITSSDESSSLSIYQKVVPQPRFPLLRLQGDLAVQNVVPGEKPWHKARLLLVQYVKGQVRHKTHHVVAALDGTRTWQHYQKDFVIAPDTESLRVIIQIHNASGSMQAKNISLRPVAKSLWYKNLQYPALACLYLFLLYLIFPYLRKQKSLLLNLLLSIIALSIIAIISLPATTKKLLKNNVEDGAKQIAATLHSQNQRILPTTLPIGVDSTKIGHFAFFILLGLLLRSAQPKRKARWILIDIILFAGTTELIQLYIDGRGALWTDALIDSSGGILGVALGMKRQSDVSNKKGTPN